MSEVKAVDCQIYKLQTLVDSGARVTIDLGYDAVWLIEQLMSAKMRGDDNYKIVFIKEE